MIGSSGFMITAIRLAFGTASFRIARRFWVRSKRLTLMPVTLPPGRARFVTKPVATGSPTSAMTIGTVFVAEMAARAPGEFTATMRLTLRLNNSSARAGSRSKLPLANRLSMIMFRPSSQPRSRSPCRKDSQETTLVSRDWAVSTPIRTGLPACCASAANGETSSPRVSKPRKARREVMGRQPQHHKSRAPPLLRAPFPARNLAQNSTPWRRQAPATRVTLYQPNAALSGQGRATRTHGPLQREVRRPLDSHCSHDHGLLYDLIRPLQERRRDRQPERLPGLDVDDQLELGGLFDGEVARLGALQDLVHVRGAALVEIEKARPVRHETPGLHTLPDAVCCRQSAPCREVCEPCSVAVEYRVGHYEKCSHTLCGHRRECADELGGTSGLQELKLHSQRPSRDERVVRIGRVRE